MAVFGIGKNRDEKKNASKVVAKEARPAKTAGSGASGDARAHDIREVLIRPRVTEKATILTGSNVYTFEIVANANKKEVAEAVKRLYNVTPRKIAIAKQPRRAVFSRGTRTRGMTTAVKKAMVFLNEGDTIQFI